MSHVTSVHMRMVTVEVTHMRKHLIILSDVVVDPHPPAWIQLGDIDCQWLQKIIVSWSKGVTWPACLISENVWFILMNQYSILGQHIFRGQVCDQNATFLDTP